MGVRYERLGVTYCRGPPSLFPSVVRSRDTTRASSLDAHAHRRATMRENPRQLYLLAGYHAPVNQPGRRAVLTAAVAGLSAGCVGDEFGTRDDVPHPLDDDDDELDQSTLESVLTFAAASADTLEQAETVLTGWDEQPAESDLDTIDQLRIDATDHLSTYDRVVGPNREAIAELSAGDAVNDREWPADGEELVEVLTDHETLLFNLEEAGIGIVDADGNPNAVSTRALEAVDELLEHAGRVVAETRSLIEDDSQ